MAHTLDPFGAYNELVRLRRGSQALTVLMLLVTAASIFFTFLMAVRPLPVVVRHDDPRRPVSVVDPQDLEDQAVREVDAKRFFYRCVGLLHGWTSLDVDEHLRQASLLMDTEWRLRFKKELISEVEVPPELVSGGHTSLLNSYRAARIRNDVEVGWGDLKCTPAEDLWHCRGRVEVESYALLGPAADGEDNRRRFEIKATFRAVPPTELTIDGLLITFWDAKEL